MSKPVVRKRDGKWEVRISTGEQFTRVAVGQWEDALDIAYRSEGSDMRLLEIGIFRMFSGSLDKAPTS